MSQPIHETLWLTCETKRCCTMRTVLPTAADIARIVRALDVAPESFLRPMPAPTDSPDAFVLDPRQPPWHATLARRAQKGKAAACTFLLKIGPNQIGRCGLGGLRPTPCRAFPASGAPELPSLAEAESCQCRTWSLGELDRASAAATLQQLAEEREQFRAIIRRWNEQAHDAAQRHAATFTHFCYFVLAAQNANETEHP